MATKPQPINGCVTWPKLVTTLLCLVGILFLGTAYMVAQQKQTSDEVVRRIDQRLDRMEKDISDIKREVQKK